jgi:hypothetical protein
MACSEEFRSISKHQPEGAEVNLTTSIVKEMSKPKRNVPMKDLSAETRLLLKELKRDPRDKASVSKEQEDEESDETTCDEDCGTQDLPAAEFGAENEDSNDQSSEDEQQDWDALDTLSSEVSWAPSLESMDSLTDFHSPDETIIIFDWDDTLCPTTAFNTEGMPTTPEGDKAVERLVVEVQETLRKARDLGAEVVIVTNATNGWIEGSCAKWMPNLLPTLDTVQFVSARSMWEGTTGITTPTDWKAAAFEQLVTKFYSRYWRQSWKNIIVIGDSLYEHEALDRVAKLAPQGFAKQCRAKSIKFEMQPSVERLTTELQMLRVNFEDIVFHDDDLNFQCFSESL